MMYNLFSLVAGEGGVFSACYKLWYMSSDPKFNFVFLDMS